MTKQVDRFIDKLYGEMLLPKVKEDLQLYHVDNLVGSAIVKAREAEKFDLDVPRGD